MSTRVRIVLPDETLAELDQVVGKRHRSAFVAEAVQEKLVRLRQHHAMQGPAGRVAGDIPAWSGPEDVTAWLRASRQQDIELLNQSLASWTEA
ncbi:MAG TPA: ribbon-helix-helix domain-containing protein [Thermomicrobiales bacterium]|nr:ribbon-helix-helix domain-containing protein [Thermomicrobiales bacterium]